MRCIAVASCVFLILTPATWPQDETPEGLPNPRLTIGKDTTVLIEPITAAGCVDYIAALEAEMRRGVTPENNANAGLRQLLGNAGLGVVGRAEYYRKLGISPPKQDAPLLVRLGDLNAEFGRDAQSILQQAMETPWTEEDLPLAAVWMERNGVALAKARDALARPKYYSPIFGGPENMFEILLPDAQASRSFGRVFVAHAMNCVATGRQGAALNDFLACRRMSGHLGSQWTVIHGLVGYAMCSMSAVAEAEFLNAAKPNLAKLKFWRRRLSTVPKALTMAERIDQGERWAMLDALGRVDRGEDLGRLAAVLVNDPPIDREAADALLDKLKDPNLDFNQIARNVNRHFDELATLMKTNDVAKREQLGAAIKRDLAARKKRLKLTVQEARALTAKQLEQWVEDFFLASLAPAWPAVLTAELRHIARQRVLDAGWALSAWYADNNVWPKQMGELVPKYIPEKPIDPFTGKALLLHVEGKACRVYSVGPNKLDEHGEKSNDRDGDIVVELRR